MATRSPLFLETLYVQEQGTHLGLNAGRIEVRRYKEVLQSFPCEWVKQIMLFGRCTLTSGMVDYCVQNKIPVMFLSLTGRYRGCLYSHTFPSIRMIKKQLKLYRSYERRLQIARSIVSAKLYNQYYVLMRRNNRKKSIAISQQINLIQQMNSQVQPENNLDVLRGYEGRSAVAFFEAIYECIPPEYQFNGRNKRPPRDPINVLLSLGYTLLFQYMESFIISQGLHPAIGFYHESMSRFSCLAADLMEEFRSPVVDSLVLTIANKSIIKPEEFTTSADQSRPCELSESGRKRFLMEFSKKMAQSYRHADFPDPVTMAGCMGFQVRRLKKSLKDPEIPYTSFKMRTRQNENDGMG
ncbi:MAG: CRISPR-associated endonuclease Cas1 [Candidatus Omnitrophota bacterium]|jgi:CRISPR-associated protein Cas1|nr:MAG: CRISPR-associated endonuclease Cas1 [Candidatus Omnitrophota bacterium]